VTRAVASAFQVLVVFGLGPLVLGVMAKVRARAEGRVGAPIHQVWRDLRKLVSKERMHASAASAVLPIAPFVVVASTAVAVAIAPLLTTRPALGHSADLFVVVALLLTGSIAIALAGLDPGTPFGAMGASRAMTIGALAEPALLVAVLALSVQAGTSNLPAIVASTLAHPATAITPARLLALGALIIVVLAETGRIPVDNPSTHLELTMIHEAMVLEYAGPELALVTLGEAARLGLLLSLLASLFAPWGIASSVEPLALLGATGALVGKVVVLAVAISVLEIRTAKLRLFRVPELLAGGFVLSVVAVITELATR
jgi:formate hydrogenlyase subunit 4